MKFRNDTGTYSSDEPRKTTKFPIIKNIIRQPRSQDFFSGEEHIGPKKSTAKIKKLNTFKIARCTRFSS